MRRQASTSRRPGTVELEPEPGLIETLTREPGQLQCNSWQP